MTGVGTDDLSHFTPRFALAASAWWPDRQFFVGVQPVGDRRWSPEAFRLQVLLVWAAWSSRASIAERVPQRRRGRRRGLGPYLLWLTNQKVVSRST